jgi:hypothetical protein
MIESTFEWWPENEDGTKWVYVAVEASVEYGAIYTFPGTLEKIPDGAWEVTTRRNSVPQIFSSLKDAADYVYWEARI